MILKLYAVSVLVAMVITVLLKIDAVNNPKDPFKAMEKLREIIEETPQLEGIIDYAMSNPSQFLLLLCICPFVNVLVIISGLFGLIRKTDEE